MILTGVVFSLLVAAQFRKDCPYRVKMGTPSDSDRNFKDSIDSVSAKSKATVMELYLTTVIDQELSPERMIKDSKRIIMQR